MEKTVKDIQNEIKRLEKECNEYMSGIQERKRELAEKLSEMLADTIKSINKNFGKIYIHTETRGENWCETVIGIIQGATYETIQFSKCIVFHNSKDSKYFEKRDSTYHVNFEIVNFEKGVYEVPATTMWGKNIIRHYEIKELSEEEANSIVKEYIEIYKEVRYSIIDNECDEYSKFISSMFNAECQDQESKNRDEDIEDKIDVIDEGLTNEMDKDDCDIINW